MNVFRPVFLLCLVVGIVAVACGTDDGPPGEVGGEPTTTPDASRLESPTPTTVAPPTTTDPEVAKVYSLNRLDGKLPARPDVQATAAKGIEFEFERKADSFPADGPRPFLEIGWNAPIPAANRDQQALIELLARIPDTPQYREHLELSDLALFLKLAGAERVSFEDGPEAYMESLETVFHELRAKLRENSPDPSLQLPAPGQAPYLSGAIEYLDRSTVFESLGIDGRNTDQTAIAGGRGREGTDFVVGRYSPELSRRLLAECDCEQPAAITEYGGFEYWTWTDGQVGNLQRRFDAPIFDHLGRGGHLLMTDTGLFRTHDVSQMEQLIDTLNGEAPSLADSPNHIFIANVMAANRANDIVFRSGEVLTKEKVLGGIGIYMQLGGAYSQSSESDRANALLAPLMLPFDFMATGFGWDGERLSEIAVLVNLDEETAVQNATRLADRLVNSNGPDGLPWSTKYDRVDISVSGNRMVVVFREGNHPGFVIFNTSGQILFAHEPG